MLADDGEIIKGEEQLQSYITQYYRRLFGPHEGEALSLHEQVFRYPTNLI
jgi:hypothetical protein